MSVERRAAVGCDCDAVKSSAGRGCWQGRGCEHGMAWAGWEWGVGLGAERRLHQSTSPVESSSTRPPPPGETCSSAAPPAASSAALLEDTRSDRLLPKSRCPGSRAGRGPPATPAAAANGGDAARSCHACCGACGAVRVVPDVQVEGSPPRLGAAAAAGEAGTSSCVAAAASHWPPASSQAGARGITAPPDCWSAWCTPLQEGEACPLVMAACAPEAEPDRGAALAQADPPQA